jgi:hypothetical protein
MKKIIYSLVAMLFMGGIITSCIEPVVSEGIDDVRHAQAEYLRSLGKLREADAEFRKAEATYQLALAAVEQGKAAQEQQKAKELELLNELLAAQNEEEIAAIMDRMEKAEIQQQIDIDGLKAELARAEKDLQDVLNAIEFEKLALSDEELTAINAIRDNYMNYLNELEGYYSDQQDFIETIYPIVYSAVVDGILDAASVEYIKATIEQEIKVNEIDLAYQQKAAEYWKGLMEDMSTDYLAEAAAYQDSINDLATTFADLLRDSVLVANTYGPIRDKAIAAADEALDKANKDAAKAFKDAVKDIKDKVNEPADAPDVADIKKDTATAKVAADFALDTAFVLPDHVSGDLITTYTAYLDAIWENYDSHINFTTNSEGKDVLEIKINEGEITKVEDYKALVDDMWAGVQEDDAHTTTTIGLWSAYNDFSRDYLYDINSQELQDDAKVLEAYAKKVQNEYDSILKILKAGKEHNASVLLDAWAKKVEQAGKDIKALVEKAENGINYTGDPDNDVYNYKDVPDSKDFKGPKVLYKYSNVRKVLAGSDYFELQDGIADFFPTLTTHPMTIGASHADSLEVFTAIKDFFKAVAAVNEKAVPYLKFMATNDNGATYFINKVRADKIEFSGIQMKKTAAYLKDKDILQAATYDNKGLENDDPATVPAPDKYASAFTNVISLFLHYVEGEAFGPVLANLYDADDLAMSYATSGVQEYLDFVKQYKTDNLNKVGFDYFRDYNKDPFKKYSQMSAEGKALYNWLDANYKYFGKDGFGSFGEGVYFIKETFTNPTRVIIYTSVPKYSKDSKGAVNGITSMPIFHTSGQYGFVLNSIENNLTEFDGSLYDAAQYDTANFGIEASLAFKSITADYLVYLSKNTDAFSATWKALGEMLQKEVKPALDELIKTVEDGVAENEAEVAAYNKALRDYNKATKDAAKAAKDAKKAANDEYDKIMEETCGAAFEEYYAKYNFYKNMYNGLMDAYALWADVASAPEALQQLLWTKYEDAMDASADIAEYIAELEIELKKLDGIGVPEGSIFGDPSGIEDETLAMLVEIYAELDEIVNSYEDEKFADLVYWYEYWKAAYEAAIARVSAGE